MQRIRTRGLLAFAGGLFSFLLLPASHAAAQQVVRGRVADAMDTPIGGAVVLLHAITDESGVELARDTADERGVFELDYAFREGPLYFVATRIEGRIYMAEPFREQPTADLVLRAGAGVEPLQLGEPVAAQPAGSVDTPDAAPSRAGWWVALIAIALVALVVLLAHRSRRRAPRARELMVEIARLDEAHASAGSSDGAGYRARREELRARLVEALELDADADRH